MFMRHILNITDKFRYRNDFSMFGLPHFAQALNVTIF